MKNNNDKKQLRVVSMMRSRSEVAMVFALHKQLTNYSLYKIYDVMVLPLQCTNNLFLPYEDVWLPLHCSSVTGMEAGQTCDASAKDPLCVHGLKCDPGKRQCSECLSFL